VSAAADDLSDYVRRVRENTQRYLRDLLGENEKLCAVVCGLERELQQYREDRQRIEERIASIEQERLGYLERYADVEAANANVANLYVATLRLHGSLSRGDVLTAIEEIVTNLIGSEELVVFEVDPGGASLRVSLSHGVDRALVEDIRFGVGIIGVCAQSGQAYTAGEPSTVAPVGLESDLTACVPLAVRGAVTGVVAIFRLFKHKPRLESIDHELFALLAEHASIALQLRAGDPR